MTEGQDHGPHRILVVDDVIAIHEDFRKIFEPAGERRMALSEAEQLLFGEAINPYSRMTYALDFASQGQDSLGLVKRSVDEGRPYTVAFIDIRMPPGLDGVETTKRLWDLCPDLQVVLCTAYADYSLADVNRLLGETDNLVILKKPFDNIEVMQLAHALTKKWLLARHLRSQLVDLDRLVHQRTEELQTTNQRLEGEAAERAHAEQNLAAEKQLLDVTLQSISDGVITTDLAGHILFMNQAAGAMTGWTDDMVQGKAFQDVLPARYPDHKEGPQDLVENVLATGTRLEFEHPIMLAQPDGGQKRLTINGAPLSDPEGKIIGVVFTFRDTTMWHLLETERFKATKLESVGVLAGGIAHDFNNILTAILANISSIRSAGSLSERQEQRLRAGENATRRAELLTKQLLTFSRGGAPILKPSSIRELIQESADFALHGSGVKCVYDLPDDLWTVPIDEGQMSQVINNLVINSQQAMPNGGTITIRGANLTAQSERLPAHLSAGHYIEIAIIDTGVGIPAEHLGNIFDPYFTTRQKASGLGLASTYSIIKNHNGYITVESEVGKGAAFLIYLPALPHETTEPEPEDQAPSKGQGRILVMDDEEDIRELCLDLLSDLGYDVECAVDGTAALERYQEAARTGKPFDLVVLDLTVQGGMGGKEAMQRLQVIDPAVKVVVSSGYSNDPVMSDYQAYGFRGVLQKPFNFVALGAMLERLMNE